jgi:ferrous iron transport protein A
MTADRTPLSKTHPGDRVCIMAVEGGKAFRARLCAMGLTPGKSAEVTRVTRGPVVLTVLGSKIVIGRGMAKHVLVRLVDNEDDA